MSTSIVFSFDQGARITTYSKEWQTAAGLQYEDLTEKERDWIDLLNQMRDPATELVYFKAIPESSLRGMIYNAIGESAKVGDILQSKKYPQEIKDLVEEAIKAATFFPLAQPYATIFAAKQTSLTEVGSQDISGLSVMDLTPIHSFFKDEVLSVFGSLSLSVVAEKLNDSTKKTKKNSSDDLTIYSEIVSVFEALPETRFTSEIIRKAQKGLKDSSEGQIKNPDFIASQTFLDLLKKVADKIKKSAGNESFTTVLNGSSVNFFPASPKSMKSVMFGEAKKNSDKTFSAGPKEQIIFPFKIQIKACSKLEELVRRGNGGVRFGKTEGSISIERDLHAIGGQSRVVFYGIQHKGNPPLVKGFIETNKAYDYKNYAEVSYSSNLGVNSGAAHALVTQDEFIGKDRNGEGRAYSVVVDAAANKITVRYPRDIISAPVKLAVKSSKKGVEVENVFIQESYKEIVSDFKLGEQIKFSTSMVASTKKDKDDISWDKMDQKQKTRWLELLARNIGVSSLTVISSEADANNSAKEKQKGLFNFVFSAEISHVKKFEKFYVIGAKGGASYGKGSVISCEIVEPTSALHVV